MKKENAFDEFVPVNETNPDLCHGCKWHTHPSTVKYLDDERKEMDWDYMDLLLCGNDEECEDGSAFAAIPPMPRS